MAEPAIGVHLRGGGAHLGHRDLRIAFDQTAFQAIDIEGQQTDAVTVDTQQAGMRHRPRAAVGRHLVSAGRKQSTLGKPEEVGIGDSMAVHAAILAYAFTRAIFGS